MNDYTPVTDTTRIDSGSFAVIAVVKNEPRSEHVKVEGTFAECDDYAQRNSSPDNYERYYVAKANVNV